MDKKVILFGCGKLGYEALNFLGSENIECFCDNNSKLVGQEIYGKAVISFDELREGYQDSVVMICADYRHSNEIAKQCERNEVFDYLYYFFFRGKFTNRKDALDYLTDIVNRMQFRKEIYMININELSAQVKYLESHIDIRDLKPAKGKLRARQLEIVRRSAGFFKKIAALEIKPFLCGGNLLGYVRHNGFIPWDDDIDFALIRKEYEELKDFFKEHIYTKEEFLGQKEFDGRKKRVSDGMEVYYWVNLGDLIKIVEPLSEDDCIEIDFFPWDFYADDYSYETMMDYARKVKKKLSTTGTTEEKIECLENALKENQENIVEKSSHLYFGIDNMTMMMGYHKGEWAPLEAVFPLKEVLYEGEHFWIPNDPEKFLTYEYSNIWEFPEDVGVPRHIAMNEEE